MGQHFTVEVSRFASGESELLAIDRDSYVLAGLNLQNQPSAMRGHFAGPGGEAQILKIGPVFLCPPGATVQVPTFPGHYRSVRCTWPAAWFEELSGITQWDKEQLARALDVRSAKVWTLLRQLANEGLHPGVGSDRLVAALGLALGIELGRYLMPDCALRDAAAAAPLSARQLEMISELVEAAEGAPVTLNRLARLCGLSPGHLARAYRETTGERLSDYIERIFCARSARLLSETDLPVKVIAHQLGFRTASSFTVAFRRVIGETPAAFRRACGAIATSPIASNTVIEPAVGRGGAAPLGLELGQIGRAN